MKVTRTSPRTGQVNTMDLDITDAQMHAYTTGTMLQDAFPNLTPAEREFWLTGYTQEDWDAIFPPDEDEDAPEEYFAESYEPSENHDKCLHCGAYEDECQCSGGLYPND